MLQPSSEPPARAGFFFREATGDIRGDSSYEEFVIANTPPACPRSGSQRMQKSHRVYLLERFRSLFGYYPYRCQECLSRFFRKRSADSLGALRGNYKRRPVERRRVWLRTRREIILYGGAIFGFLIFLLFMMREPSPKADQP